VGRRRKESLTSVLIRLPWWMSAIGVLVVLVLRQVWLAWVDGSNDLGMYADVVRQLHWWFYGFAMILALGSLASLIRHRWNGRKIEAQLGKDSFDALHWREFEALLQEAFHRQGYLSVETQSGADGGYDIALRKDGKLYLVQCKHWKAQKVGVAPVRELFGVIAARGAAGGFFVTSGYFTEDAKAFAAQTKLTLIDGPMLKKLIAHVARAKPVADVQSERIDPVVTLAPDCPKCGAEMIKRVAKKDANAGKEFWGCSEYPRCWGAANV